jgi:Icc-related predicted phosphoesterase
MTSDSAAADPPRLIRIAAIGDLHIGALERGALARRIARVSRDADILVLCGDLTDQGRPDQMHGLADELTGLEIPIVAVFGNHDYENNAPDELGEILRGFGVHLLDGTEVVIDGVGFAGAKGFGGGFDRHAISAFGERTLREFVQETIDETLKLENALRTLTTQTRVVVMHYAPIAGTLKGESLELFPVLGSSRFLEPIETHGANVVFHAHAHYGAPEGRTPSGVPVYNVALSVLDRAGIAYRIWTAGAPDRRASGG